MLFDCDVGSRITYLILIQFVLAPPVQSQPLMLPQSANAQFVPTISKTRIQTMKTPAATQTSKAMSAAVMPGATLTATGLPIKASNAIKPVVPYQAGAALPYAPLPPTQVAANSNANNMTPLLAAMMSQMAGGSNNGSGLGGPTGGGKNAYTPDYSDYTDSSGVTHSSKTYPTTRSSKPSGSGHFATGGKGNPFRCDSDSKGDVLTGTFYNLPHQDRPNSWGSYKQFMDWRNVGSSYDGKTGHFSNGSVNVEGSGICDGSDSRCSKNYVLHYTGVVERNKCPQYFGEATTQAGGPLKPGEVSIDPNAKAGDANCLVPFFSVAGDSGYPRGTIIEVPELKGHTVYLPPNGTPVKHPGFFMVQDRGIAIWGRNRFDFFTGSYEQRDSKNIFGNTSIDPDYQMDIKACRNHVRAIKPGDAEYADALSQIRSAVASANGGRVEGYEPEITRASN